MLYRFQLYLLFYRKRHSVEDSSALKDVHAELEEKEAALNEKDVALLEVEKRLSIALSEQAAEPF